MKGRVSISSQDEDRPAEGSSPNVSIRVIPVLASHVKNLLSMKTSWSARCEGENAKIVDRQTYSLSAAMADTTW